MAASHPLAGRSLDDRYLIEGRIGAGGMGSVYRGRHLLMDRKVALKILRPDLAHDPNAARRFAREAKSAFRFDHPHCVRVSDFGITADGLVYLVMELLDGRTVGDELHYDGAMSSLRVARVARQVCDALHHAHSLGLVHRDLKPDNVMLIERDGDPDFVKVLDFGLAKLFATPEAGGEPVLSMAGLTQQGTVYGTPEYMSPEQAMGQSLDPRSDLYSLGVLMYEMATGVLPFQKGNYMATLTAHVKEIPVPPAQRRPDLGISAALDAVITRLLAKQPGERYPSAFELSAILDRLAAELQPSHRVPRSVAASETLDLSQSAVVRTAREPDPPAPAPTASASALTTNKWIPGRARRRLVVAVVSTAIAGAAVATIVAATRAPSSSSASPASRPDVAATTSTVTAASQPDAAPRALPPQPASKPAAKPVEPAKPARVAKPLPKKPSKRREKLDAHLAAAARARAAGQTLKQIAEADSALRIDRRSSRAAYLLGDGLLRSGDKLNGCEYLRRARALRAARDRSLTAGCPR